MKSDETAYQELFEELEKYENKGVYISMDGFPASPMLYAGLYSGYRRIY